MYPAATEVCLFAINSLPLPSIMKPQIAVIDSNTLNCMALRSILCDMLPWADVLTYNSMEEFGSESHEMVVHYFAGAEIVFRNMPMFQANKRRTIVIVEGGSNTFSLSGFRTIDATQSEAGIVKDILRIHETGHPSGHRMTAAPAANNAEHTLSQRERDVLALMVKGYINKEIADRLNISTTTVIFHRKNISEKLNTRSIGRLTIYAVINGIVDIREL